MPFIALPADINDVLLKGESVTIEPLKSVFWAIIEEMQTHFPTDELWVGRLDAASGIKYLALWGDDFKRQRISFMQAIDDMQKKEIPSTINQEMSGYEDYKFTYYRELQVIRDWYRKYTKLRVCHPNPYP